jgi:hypothetical protein
MHEILYNSQVSGKKLALDVSQIVEKIFDKNLPFFNNLFSPLNPCDILFFVQKICVTCFIHYIWHYYSNACVLLNWFAKYKVQQLLFYGNTPFILTGSIEYNLFKLPVCLLQEIGNKIIWWHMQLWEYSKWKS